MARMLLNGEVGFSPAVIQWVRCGKKITRDNLYVRSLTTAFEPEAKPGESMDKNRMQGASTGRAGNVPRSPYPSTVRSVDSATVRGRRLSLPQDICSVSLRRLRA